MTTSADLASRYAACFAVPYRQHPAVVYGCGVLDGSIPAGRLVCLAVERDLHDHEHRSETGLAFHELLAARSIEWYTLCNQYEGEFAGKPLSPQPWQQFVDWVTYGWYRRDGTRRWRTRYIEVPSGNGKTTWMAADALRGLVADGEPGAEVYACAVKEDQARILWSAAARMIDQSPSLQRVLRSYDSVNNHRITYPGKFGVFVPLPRDTGGKGSSSEGKKPHRVYFDELHEYRDRKQVDVLRTKAAKRRQPLITFTTTADDGEPETLYEELHDYAVGLLDGWQTGAFVDDSTLVVIYALDEDEDPFADDLTETDMLAMIGRCNPNLGVSVQTSAVVEHWRRALKVEAERGSFLRYRGDRRASTLQREIQPAEWDACVDSTIDWSIFATVPCVAAVDLSLTTDLTAITLHWRLGGIPYYRFLAFMPADNVAEACKRDMVPYDRWVKAGWIELTPGNMIDPEFIARRAKELSEEYTIVQWAGDPWRLTHLAIALQRESAIELVGFRQDLKSFAEPTMLYLDELRTGLTRHDANPLARWCALNVVTKEDSFGGRVPHKRASKKRIDPIVAAIMARGRAILLDLEHFATPGTSIYDAGPVAL